MAYITRTRIIKPKEGEIIGAFLDERASEADKFPVLLENMMNYLDETWEGVSKDEFMEKFENAPKEATIYADKIRTSAARIRNITVTETYVEEVPDSY